MASLTSFPVEKQVDFTEDPVENARLWAIRKDTFPAVGAVRKTGTTVIIEDVTFPVEQLAIGVNRLIELFDKHHYDEAILFGHALEGNLHFVFTQGFNNPEEVARYQAFMDDVAQLVAVEFGGSLKAEHGTGRNMAPFVELEWGSDAYQLMWQLKRLLDPNGILNPDVVLSEDPQIHLKHLKPLPAADEIVDKCIECGFCEPVCPSKGLTLSPRQRIVIWRDIQAKKRAGVDTTELEARLRIPGHRHLRRHRPLRPTLPCRNQHRRAGEKAARPYTRLIRKPPTGWKAISPRRCKARVSPCTWPTARGCCWARRAWRSCRRP